MPQDKKFSWMWAIHREDDIIEFDATHEDAATIYGALIHDTAIRHGKDCRVTAGGVEGPQRDFAVGDETGSDFADWVREGCF